MRVQPYRRGRKPCSVSGIGVVEAPGTALQSTHDVGMLPGAPVSGDSVPRRRLGTLIQPGIGLAACTGLRPDHRRGVRLPHRRGRRVRGVCAGRRASSSRPSMVVT